MIRSRQMKALKMKELIKKIIDAGKGNALDSLDDFKEAASGLGFSEEQVEKALDGFDGFPLDDDDLAEIAGGISVSHVLTNSVRKVHYSG